MIQKITKGNGITGMIVTLGLNDMFAINQVADKVEEIIKAKTLREGYMKCPFDQRKVNYPEGEPGDKNLDIETLDKVRILLNKMSYATASDVFKPNTGADYDIDEH